MFFSGFDVDQRKLWFFFIISDWLTWWNPISPKTFLTLDEIEHFYVIFYAYKITKHSFMSHQMSRYIYSMYALIYFHSDPQFFYSLSQLLYTSEFSPCSWRLRMLMVSHYTIIMLSKRVSKIFTYEHRHSRWMKVRFTWKYSETVERSLQVFLVRDWTKFMRMECLWLLSFM